MQLIIKGSPKEIAALVLAVHERREEQIKINSSMDNNTDTGIIDDATRLSSSLGIEAIKNARAMEFIHKVKTLRASRP